MTPEEEEARDRLLFHLENQSGFWFAMVVGEDAAPRVRLCEVAESWCKEHGRAFTLYEPEPDGLVTLAVTLASGASPGVHWIRADGVKALIDVWNAGAAQMLMAMNERREAYRKRLEGGIIVEGRSSLKRILREMAPDLFSIRAFIAEPGEEPKAQTSDFPEWRPPVSLTSMISGSDVDPDLALARLARLTTLEDPATKAWIGAEELATVSLFNAGRYDEAERHARELLSKLEQSAGADPDNVTLTTALACQLLAQITVIQHDNRREALRFLDHAVERMKSHAINDPDKLFSYKLLAVQTTKERANLLFDIGEIDAARSDLEQHIGMFSNPATNLAPELQLDFLDSHVKLARILIQQREFVPAEGILQSALETANACAAKNPGDDRWQLEVLRSIAALGAVQLAKQDIAAASKTLLPAAVLAERMEAHGSASEVWRNVLNEFYLYLGCILSYAVKYSRRSDRTRERALTSIRKQFDEEPDNIALGWLLAAFYLRRAILLETADVTGAKDAAQQALDLAAKLPVQNEENAATKRRIDALRSFVRKPRKKRRTAKH